MANEKRLIDANAVIAKLCKDCGWGCGIADEHCILVNEVMIAPTVDAVEVVRCQDCVHAEPLDRNCEISAHAYMHCKLWRGDETKNVWHKYKKYYKDYSIVDRGGFCDDGERIDNGR